jgi:hypothetical protein
MREEIGKPGMDSCKRSIPRLLPYQRLAELYEYMTNSHIFNRVIGHAVDRPLGFYLHGFNMVVGGAAHMLKLGKNSGANCEIAPVPDVRKSIAW